MHFLVGFLVGAMVFGGGVGYVAFVYGKKIGAAVNALGAAVDTVKKA